MTTIEEIKKICDEAAYGDVSSACLVRINSSKFIPEAIRLIEVMAEALRFYQRNFEDKNGNTVLFATNALAAFDAMKGNKNAE